MKIKNILKWTMLTLIFIVISFYFFRITTYIMKPSHPSLNNIAGFYGEKKNSLDMVYIGGSAAFEYWEPLRAFESKGIASYNYGSNRVQAEAYKTMIKEVFKRQKPKLILIDARAFQYRENEQPPIEQGYRNVLTGIPLSLNKIDFISKNVKKYLNDDPLSYYFDIIKYHRDLKGEDVTNQIKMAFNIYKNPYKGFNFVPQVEAQPIIDHETNIKTPIGKETEDILINLLEFLKTTDCKYLFVVSPYVEPKNHKENFNYISEIIEQYGYNFLDCNDFIEEMNINFSTDFYNIFHVNIFGAEKYTDFLINYLMENYELPDRKDDEDYYEWIQLLENWNQKVETTKKEINKLIEEKE